MKHWLSLVNVPEVDQYIELAKFAEELGFYGVAIADHLVMPAKIETPYPYTPDGKMWWPAETPWADPWVTLAALGAVTKKLRFTTNIYLAALRDPFTAAKAISTAAVLTNNRVACGISAGWLKEEFDLVNVDFKTRGKRLDEIVEAMKVLWTGEVVSHKGEFFEFSDVIMQPAPTAPIPVYSGGGSKAALQRAARNDGWLGLPMTLNQLLETINYLKSLRSEYGKADQPFDILFSLVETTTAEKIARLQEAGATHNVVLPWVVTPWGKAKWLGDEDNTTLLDVKKRAMERFAEDVIRRTK